MPLELQMPKIGFKQAVAIGIPFLLVEIGLIWWSRQNGSGWILAAVLILPVIFGGIYYRSRRCPKCGRRLRMRREVVGPTRVQIKLDCTNCDVTYNTGHFVDDSID